jgi:hypothetical protein
MNRTSTTSAFYPTRGGIIILAAAAVTLGGGQSLAQDPQSNACPVDGCQVKIVDVKRSGKELALTLKANYKPDMSKNHVHVWWGENYTIKQVSGNAEPVHHVKQGDWHPTDEYPAYITQGAASVAVHGKAKTLCVSPADRNHNILDVSVLHCVKVGDLL